MKQLIQRFIRQEGMTLLFLSIIFATIILIFFCLTYLSQH